MGKQQIDEKQLTDFLLYLENQSQKEFKKWLTGINFFELLGISTAEIRHSRILAWLLDPKESHKLGSQFLEKFLLKILEKNSSTLEIKSTNIFLWDFLDGMVYRESKNNIDILFSSKKNKFNLIIENKTFTVDHDNQLKKYRHYIEKEYPDYTNLFVYLTPNGDEPIDASFEEKKHWKLISYYQISEILIDLIETIQETSKVQFIIKEYNDNIRRNILTDEELKQLSADIYFKYKEVLDLIINNRPDSYSVLRDAFTTVLNELNDEGKIIYDSIHDDTAFIRFRTKTMDSYLSNEVKYESGWGGSLYYYEIDQWKALPTREIQLKLSIVNSTSYVSDELNKKITKFTNGRYYKGKKLSNEPYSYNTEHRFLKLNLSLEEIWGDNMVSILKDFVEENLQKILQFEQKIMTK